MVDKDHAFHAIHEMVKGTDNVVADAISKRIVVMTLHVCSVLFTSLVYVDTLQNLSC